MQLYTGTYVSNPLAVSGSGPIHRDNQRTLRLRISGLNLIDDVSIKDARAIRYSRRCGESHECCRCHSGGHRNFALGEVNRDGNPDMIFTNFAAYR